MDLVLYIFVVFWGSVSGWLWEWIVRDYGMEFGSILASKIEENGIGFGSDLGVFFRGSFGGVQWR